MLNTINQKILLIGNWKLNPQDIKTVTKLITGISQGIKNIKNVESVVCPSFVHLLEFKNSYRGKKLILGAQDVSLFYEGAHTGEISATQLKNIGCQYCIVGHSERRAVAPLGQSESNEQIAKKISILIDNSITPILCVGEATRSHSGDYLNFIEKQLLESLCKVSRYNINKVVIAYEPLWAIGNNHSANSNQVHEMMLYIKKIVANKWGRKSTLGVKVIYGGSVKPNNITELLNDGKTDGFLVGSASLDVDSFITMAKNIDHNKKINHKSSIKK